MTKVKTKWSPCGPILHLFGDYESVATQSVWVVMSHCSLRLDFFSSHQKSSLDTLSLIPISPYCPLALYFKYYSLLGTALLHTIPL